MYTYINIIYIYIIHYMNNIIYTYIYIHIDIYTVHIDLCLCTHTYFTGVTSRACGICVAGASDHVWADPFPQQLPQGWVATAR